MTGSSATLPIQETDVTVLKETLRSQQRLLQKLYAELDVERESSATATNEALSMILRLQGEKASIKMEASQYKRLAEEKMGHAEESLAILEELIYQKEMEISSLEFQVQAYRYKLLSLGCDDLNDFERNDTIVNGEKGIKATFRRLTSLPASLPIDFYLKKTGNDGENNLAPVHDSCSSMGAGNLDTVVRGQGLDSRTNSLNSTAGGFNSYLEQIRILDEKVKEISDCKEVGIKKISNTSSLKRPNSSSACSSSVVHDVFEVPDIHEVPETSAKSKICLDGEKCNGKSILQSDDDRLTKPDLILEDSLGLPADKDEIDWIKMNNFLSGKPQKTSCKLRDDELPAQYGTECVKINKLLSVNDQTNADCKSALLHRADDQSELKQLSQRVEQLERGRNNTRHEIVQGREEELNLLKDLREQLNSIQSEMRSWRQKEHSPSPSDEVNLVPFTEAMLYFWL